MSETKFKPCPLCGSDGRLQKDEHSGTLFAYCDGSSCLISVGENYDPDGMPAHAFYEEEAAIAAWNTRAPDPQRQRLVDALKAIRDNGMDASMCAVMARAVLEEIAE